jgi:pyruvate dehydrogenase E1 component beta subunit
MYGGTYSISRGLLEEFGGERIKDTPLSEGGFMGVGIGLALSGMKPIVEIMTINFSLLALDQLINSAAMIKSMSGNQLSVPLIVRMSSGGEKQLGAQHSNSLESWLSHIPGLKILTLSTVEDARWMLSFALKESDPVILIEYPKLFDMEGDVSTYSSFQRDFSPQVLRSGSDLTIITYGATLEKALRVENKLKQEKISLEVINLRSLRPLIDLPLIKSAMKTKKVLLVDEAWSSGGIMSEIFVRISENTEALVQRFSKMEVPHPYGLHLERKIVPQEESIEEKIKELLYAS